MATIFRPPIIVTVYPRRKAADEWSGNLRVLYAPNPAVPFKQLDWPLATRAGAKSVGEAVAAPAPLYTPNPAAPFRQSDWINAAIGRLPQKSDAPTYFIGPKPFTEPSWPAIPRGRAAAKVDDVVNLVPLQNPVVVVAAPFAEFSWPPPQRGRAAKVDDVVNLVPIQNPAVIPFRQGDWPLAVTPRKPAIVDTVELPYSIYVTFKPFAGLTETRQFARPAAITDAFVNLLPIQSAPVIFPFSLTDWSTVARPNFPAIVDAVESPVWLYAPPFVPVDPGIQPLVGGAVGGMGYFSPDEWQARERKIEARRRDEIAERMSLRLDLDRVMFGDHVALVAHPAVSGSDGPVAPDTGPALDYAEIKRVVLQIRGELSDEQDRILRDEYEEMQQDEADVEMLLLMDG